ncbi:MAG: YolD-like family protein [Defluviitaleaceae bacterium]|nr:YolD-like family protein [Defluviitaleaceae bacterium]
MFKKIARKRNRHKYEESTIKPNVELAIDDLADYQQVIKKERDLGYKGLQGAFSDKATVKLTVVDSEGNNEEVTGVISHYDDTYSQLVIVNGNNLKRLTFEQIVDARFSDGGIINEELSD